MSLPAQGTFAMVVALKPLSVNRGRPSPRYTSQIQVAALAQGARILTGCLYARITWFQLHKSPGDVDNIAKRILDSLVGVVIQDDDIVRCLIQKTVADSTGRFALRSAGAPSPRALLDLQTLFGVEEHVLYIEIGPVTDANVSFGPVL